MSTDDLPRLLLLFFLLIYDSDDGDPAIGREMPPQSRPMVRNDRRAATVVAKEPSELLRIPAEIWRRDNKKVTRLIVSKSPVASLELDPLRELADAVTTNNHWPGKPDQKVFRMSRRDKDKNPMQLRKEAEEKAKKEAAEEATEAAEKEASEGDAQTPPTEQAPTE